METSSVGLAWRCPQGQSWARNLVAALVGAHTSVALGPRSVRTPWSSSDLGRCAHLGGARTSVGAHTLVELGPRSVRTPWSSSDLGRCAGGSTRAAPPPPPGGPPTRTGHRPSTSPPARDHGLWRARVPPRVNRVALAPIHRLYSSAWLCCSGAVALGTHWALGIPQSFKLSQTGLRRMSSSAPMPLCCASRDGPSGATCASRHRLVACQGHLRPGLHRAQPD